MNRAETLKLLTEKKLVRLILCAHFEPSAIPKLRGIPNSHIADKTFSHRPTFQDHCDLRKKISGPP